MQGLMVPKSLGGIVQEGPEEGKRWNMAQFGGNRLFDCAPNMPHQRYHKQQAEPRTKLVRDANTLAEIMYDPGTQLAPKRTYCCTLAVELLVLFSSPHGWSSLRR